MKILLLEDELAIRSAMKRGLKRAGHEVFDAANLSEARSLANEHEPNLLLSDLKLPDGSGLQMAEALMIPFIIMSGYAVFDDAVAALRLGCVDFFTKPVSIESIVHRIQALGAGLGQETPHCIAFSDNPELSSSRSVQYMQLRSNDFDVQEMFVRKWSWVSQTAAHRIYNEADMLVDNDDKLLLSEILQISDEGSMVLNQRPGCCTIWLTTAVDWQQSQEQEDRFQLIGTLSDVCVQRGHGLFVERYGQSDHRSLTGDVK